MIESKAYAVYENQPKEVIQKIAQLEVEIEDFENKVNQRVINGELITLESFDTTSTSYHIDQILNQDKTLAQPNTHIYFLPQEVDAIIETVGEGRFTVKSQVGYRMGQDGENGKDGATGPTGPQGPQGPEGPTGPQGPEGPTGPQGGKGVDGTNGKDGTDGRAATVTVGETTTLPAGENATVENVGTSSAAIFNFGIPKGADGSGSKLYRHNISVDISITTASFFFEGVRVQILNSKSDEFEPNTLFAYLALNKYAYFPATPKLNSGSGERIIVGLSNNNTQTEALMFFTSSGRIDATALACTMTNVKDTVTEI